VNQSEGSLYIILTDERITQRSQQGGACRGEGGSHVICITWL